MIAKSEKIFVNVKVFGVSSEFKYIRIFKCVPLTLYETSSGVDIFLLRRLSDSVGWATLLSANQTCKQEKLISLEKCHDFKKILDHNKIFRSRDFAINYFSFLTPHNEENVKYSGP